MNNIPGGLCIDYLVICNERGEVVYSYDERQKNTTRNERAITKLQKEKLNKELERTGVEMEAVLDRFHLSRSEDMTVSIYDRAMNALAKTKSA